MEAVKKTSSRKEQGNGFEKPLLRETVYEHLKTAIQTGELQPGEPLYELQLSEMLQISRTPVREALQQLVLEGLVKNMPNRAMTVASLSMQDVLNVLHIRSLLEPEIVRLVAKNASTELTDTLMSIVHQLEDAAERDDRLEWSKADTEFHELLSQYCPNTLLGQLGLQMRNRMHVIATDVQTTTDRLKACSHEHRVIAEAIANHDSEAAKEATLLHIEQLRESFFKRLSHM